MDVALASNTLPANSILPCPPEPPSGAPKVAAAPWASGSAEVFPACEAHFELGSSSLLVSRKGKDLFVSFFVLFEGCVCVCVRVSLLGDEIYTR